jgi:acetylornithine deacetylase/succinyl-diaminopimelate desuccinylase-like protein
MKSGVAAAMLATRALARARDRWRGTVLFSSVVDEEAYSLGARAQIAAGLQADYCVVTEASWERPCLGGVGKALVRADVTGRAAHATWPAAGINAAVEAARLAVAVDDVPLGTHPRIEASQCVLALHAGPEQYVVTVPDTAWLQINRHLVPGETAESVLAQYRALAAGLGSPARFDLSLAPPYYPPWEIAPDHPFVRAFARAYAGETGSEPDWGYRAFGDANLFAAEAGIPTVQFGPHGGSFHQPDEWVDVPSIAGTVRVLLRLALDVLR